MLFVRSNYVTLVTRARLLDIAIREFGHKGQDGASTRDIAAAAGTAMSSITYHYGGKEGLYLAAADHIAQRMADEMAPALAAEDGVGDDAGLARAALQRLLARLVDKMTSDDVADYALFIMREQLEPGEAFERIYAGVMGQLTRRLADLVCVATGADTATARVATITLMSQSLAVRASRGAVLRLLEIDDIDAATLDRLKKRIAANTDAVLDRLIAEERP